VAKEEAARFGGCLLVLDHCAMTAAASAVIRPVVVGMGMVGSSTNT
jgi:hypothetical protein